MFELNNDVKLAKSFRRNIYGEEKYRTTRVIIDSRFINSQPKNILPDKYHRIINPFSFVKNSNIMTIKIENHEFMGNDKIIIDGVVGSSFYLKSFEFSANSPYVKIYHKNHLMSPFGMDYKIQIKDISNNGNPYLDGIPINLLNNTHKVYFNTDDSVVYDVDYYYIKLPLAAGDDKVYETSYNVIFKHLYGVPINLINANYPITTNRYKGFHDIYEIVDENTFTVVMDVVANNTVEDVGGEINIDRIERTIQGFPNSSNYIFDLGKTFYNVERIRLISSEIPNTDKAIRNYPEVRRNNLFYWQIINDGDLIYSIEITPGNYDIAGLIDEITNKVVALGRCGINMDINPYTSVCNIQFTKDVSLENPFRVVDIDYLEITQENHLLNTNLEIVITGSTNISYVPSDVINGTHKIYSIIDKDKYMIKLRKFNPLETDDTHLTGGGVAVNIVYPLMTRLLFDRPGTIGCNIGFRNVGDAITEWGYVNSNNLPYVNDLLVDSIGQALNVSSLNNYINLNGYNYILLLNPLFKNNIGEISNVFSKLLLSGPPGTVIYNDFIQIGDELHDTVKSLKELEFQFVTPDGEPYYFNNIHHSFTIEIYEKIFNNGKLNNSSNAQLHKNFYDEDELEEQTQ